MSGHAERRLVAILAADVVGYSRMIRADEEGTLTALKVLRTELIDPKLAEHDGRIVKLMGDGMLVEFPSVVKAVRAAVETQGVLADHNAPLPEGRRIQFRVGINLGDVVIEGDDIHGDGVNVAARLEGIADPGGICVSAAVYDQVKNRLGVAFEDLGDREVKNIDEPVRVWRWKRDAAEQSLSTAAHDGPPLPRKPSIAVLPFTNMSGDPEQEYFADGVVEEIIVALSRMRWLFVIARNSSFTYKGRATDMKQVGRELGVRYLLEGSVRKAGNKVRITGQLIDALTGVHLWADRFDGELADIFDLQDQVTANVAGAVAPRLQDAEIERAKRKPTDSLDAYDYFLRGMSAFHQWSKNTNVEALELFLKAVELDPNFASAYAMASRCYAQRKSMGGLKNPEREVAESLKLAKRAIELGRDDAVALCSAGSALAFVVGDLDLAGAAIDDALRLDSNMAWAWLSSSLVKTWLGEPEPAIEQAARAMRLSPFDTQFFVMQTATAMAHFVAERYTEALSWAKKSSMAQPDYVPATALVAASAAFDGNLVEGKEALERLRSLVPALRISNVRDLLFPFKRTHDFNMLLEALRKAGLPE